jgi:hypothetical protein
MTSAISHGLVNPNRPRSTDPKNLAYEQAREQYRQDNPMPTGEGLHQLSDIRKMPYRDRIRLASPEQLEAHPELSIKPKIYIASKAKHRPRWREFRDINGYDIISKWIDIPDKFSQDSSGMDYKRLWLNCVQDVRDCDVLVMYAEPGEVMKGALIELGIALGLGKEIIVAGDLGDNGTWWNHPNVQRSDKSVEDLMLYIHG